MAIDQAIDLSEVQKPLKDLGLPNEIQGIEKETEQEDLSADASGLSFVDRPIPGQSLTNDPESPMPFEKPSRFNSVDEASEQLFKSLTSEDNITEVLDLLRRDLPVEDVAQIFLFEMFRTGLINTDLMLLMIEPAIHSLIFIADYAGIEVVISKDDDMSSSKLKESKELSKKFSSMEAPVEGEGMPLEDNEPLLDLGQAAISEGITDGT